MGVYSSMVRHSPRVPTPLVPTAHELNIETSSENYKLLGVERGERNVRNKYPPHVPRTFRATFLQHLFLLVPHRANIIPDVGQRIGGLIGWGPRSRQWSFPSYRSQR